MQASRRELLDDFIGFMGEASDARARDVAERLLNRALHTIWMKHPWRQFLMPVPITVTLVPGQRSYVLPTHFGRILGGRVRNLTQQYDLAAIEPVLLQTAHPEVGTSLETPARPELYTVSGTCGVDVLLLAPETLTVQSDNPVDASKVSVEGYDVDGRWQWQQVSLVGTTPIVLPWPVVPWVFGKAIPEATVPVPELTSSGGSVWLSTQATGQVLQILRPSQSAAEHQLLTVYPVPNAPDTLAVPYLRAVSKAQYDGDPIPNNWQEALFEEMTIQWRVNTGEMSLDTMNVVRPKFLDLLAFEQANRFESIARIRPFRG